VWLAQRAKAERVTISELVRRLVEREAQRDMKPEESLGVEK
jgi:hypothetical protein